VGKHGERGSHHRRRQILPEGRQHRRHRSDAPPRPALLPPRESVHRGLFSSAISLPLRLRLGARGRAGRACRLHSVDDSGGRRQRRDDRRASRLPATGDRITAAEDGRGRARRDGREKVHPPGGNGQRVSNRSLPKTGLSHRPLVTAVLPGRRRRLPGKPESRAFSFPAPAYIFKRQTRSASQKRRRSMSLPAHRSDDRPCPVRHSAATISVCEFLQSTTVRAASVWR